MKLSDDASAALLQILPILKKFQVEIIAIGGIAVAHYGHYRISGGPVKGPIKADLDFWYKPTTENFLNLLKALSELGVDKLRRNHLIRKNHFLKFPTKLFTPISYLK